VQTRLEPRLSLHQKQACPFQSICHRCKFCHPPFSRSWKTTR
jgi:hypothetical protein